MIFFTKNGGFLGDAFENVSIPTEENSLLYATVSIANFNEKIRANFNESQQRFKFDA